MSDSACSGMKDWRARKEARKTRDSVPFIISSPSRDKALRDGFSQSIEERDGLVYPRGSGVSVKQVAYLYGVARQGPFDIVDRFAKDLTFAQLHVALAYYYLHKDAMDAELNRELEFNSSKGLSDASRRLPRVGLGGLLGVVSE